MTAARTSSSTSARSNEPECLGSTRDKRSLLRLLLTERAASPRRTICAPSERDELVNPDHRCWQVSYGPVSGSQARGFDFTGIRSEERRVGKECRSRWSPYH